MSPGADASVGEPPPVDQWDPAPAPPAIPDMTVKALANQINALLASVPYTHSVRVENASTGQLIVSATPERLLAPASNTKLFTTAAALELLGEDAGFALTAYTTGPLSATGTLSGNLVIVGGHDLTLSSAIYPSPRVPFDRLALQLHRAGLRSVSGTVILTGEFVYEGDSLGTLDVVAERASVVAPARDAITAAGITIGTVTTSASLEPPAGAQPIAVHAPITMLAIASHINVPSHNEFADLVSRRLGYVGEGSSSFVAGTRAVIQWLAGTGVSTTGVVFNDGSGLSHGNRVSANVITSLLNYMAGSPLGTLWRRTLSIGGDRGTLAGRLTGPDTHGRVFAKTGTLSDAVALSGYLENRYDGQQYRFSILLNAVTDATTARARADAIVETIARNHRASPPRLKAPRLDVARGVGFAGLLEIRWQPAVGATGYLVWLSEDGRVWTRERARKVDRTRVVFDQLPADRATYVRITALDPQGLESDPSQVLVGWAATRHADVLLVDANERWQAEPMPRNTMGQHHDFLVGLSDVMPSRRVDSVTNHAVVDDGFALADYPLALWALGEESTANDPMSDAEQQLVSTYVAGGGALIASGSELLFVLNQRGTPADRRFIAEVLHTGYAADDAGTQEFAGLAGTPFADLPLASFHTPDGLSVDYPDVLSPIGGGVPLVEYIGGTGGTAVVGHRDTGCVVVSGFPVEAILSSTVRGAFLEAAYTFCGMPTASR